MLILKVCWCCCCFCWYCCWFCCCCRCLADLPTLHGLSSSGLSRCSSVSSDEERNDLNCRGKIQTKVIHMFMGVWDWRLLMLRWHVNLIRYWVIIESLECWTNLVFTPSRISFVNWWHLATSQTMTKFRPTLQGFAQWPWSRAKGSSYQVNTNFPFYMKLY